MEINSLEKFAVECNRQLNDYLLSHPSFSFSSWQMFYQMITIELLKQKGYTHTPSFFADEQLIRQFPSLFSSVIDCDFDASFLLQQLPVPLNEETLGRLHQYFQSGQKQQAYRQDTVSKEDLPSATQLFTPHWIIEYLVQNSIGKLWMNTHPDSQEYLKWNCYVPSDPLPFSCSLQDVTVMDPAMGCGHLLLEVFDFMMKLYSLEHRDLRQSALHFLHHQCHGVDLDPRAVRIATTALLIKAEKFVPGLINTPVQLSLMDCQRDSLSHGRSVPELEMLARTGSLCPTEQMDPSLCDLIPLLQRQYDIVITNPPYLGSHRMDPQLRDFMKQYYPLSKLDLYAAFIEKSMALTKPTGLTAMITQQSWMFLSGYQKLREKILSHTLITMAHLGPRAFEEIKGEVVQTTCFVLSPHSDPGYRGVYDRLVEPSSSYAKYQLFLQKTCRYSAAQKDYTRIPGSPVAYWATPQQLQIFSQPTLKEIAVSPGQNVTGDNRKYLRKHWELDREQILHSHRWIFYAKGGGYRKWWGNLENMIDWSEQAREEYRQRKGSTASQIIKPQYWYRKGITWGLIASEQPSFRVMPEGATFDKGGSTILVKEEYYNTILALSNSKVILSLLRMLNSTLSFQVKDVYRMPIPSSPLPSLDSLTEHCLSLSKADWDGFETSFHFCTHPMIDHSQSLRQSYRHWQKQCEQRFFDLKHTEEQINQILMDTFHLDMDPTIQLKEVTVHRIFDTRDQIPDNMKISPYALTGKQAIKSFISYGIRCLFQTTDHLCIPQITDHFIHWLTDLYGPDTLDDNLQFLATMIHNKETEPHACLNYYFQTEFYKDHVSRFQKRPIYWLFDSGREHTFQVLVDMKQLTPQLFDTIRFQLLSERVSYYQNLYTSQPTARHLNQLQEILSYQSRILTLTPCTLDLNDGVAANMKKLQTDPQGQLQKIFGLSEKVIKE